jgi:hypothetical protein
MSAVLELAGNKQNMSLSTPVEKIRKVIAAQLNSLGASQTQSMAEAILIRDGLFCGRKFQCEGYEVVWFIEEDEIKFFGPCGDLLKSTSAIACIRQYEEQQAGFSERRAA